MSQSEVRALIVHCAGPSEAVISTTEPLAGDDQLAIWTASLSDLRPSATSYLPTLDRQEHERMERFRFDADRERFLLGHGLLRALLGRYLHTPPERIRFKRGRFGKPYIEGSAIDFNLSDTKDAVAIAIGRRQDIGVDIETMSRKVDHEAVGQHYFTNEEVDAIQRARDGKRQFLEFWTRKEAVLKASGVGIMDDLRVLRVDEPVNRMTISHEAFIDMAAPAYHVRTWHVGPSRIVSLASARELGNVQFFLAP